MEEKYEQIEFNSVTENGGTQTDEINTAEAVSETVQNETVINSAERDAENSEPVSAETRENAATEEKIEGSENEEATEKAPEEEKKTSRRRSAKDVSEQSDGTENAIAPEKMSKTEAMRVLEAIMFANGDEVYYDQFAKIIGYTTKEATKIVDAYAKMYDSGSMPRGIRFVRYEKCCQLTTAPDLGEYVTQMIGIRGEPQLSQAAMETLAIVAYNQPVTRAYIEQVRRVDSTRPITVLLDRELIEEKGRLDVIGRPRLFGTTQNFLRTFGISSLEELPSLDLFSIEG